MYMICDGNGYALTSGVQEHEIEAMAQSMATQRGESVWVSTMVSDEDDIGNEYEPQTKADVTEWKTVATYVATFGNGKTDGACDVEVQIGCLGTGSYQLWFVRTEDAYGGNDDASDEAYFSRGAAVDAANSMVTEKDEGLGMNAVGWLAYAATQDENDKDEIV